MWKQLAAGTLVGVLIGVGATASLRGAESGAPDRIDRGKAATAFVEIVGGSTTATAFCIREDGLFVTNDHVVRSVSTTGRVKLVLNANRQDRRELWARVLKRDAASDLAVLRIEEERKGLPVLELGEDSKLFETQPVTAFGFPFGRRVVSGKSVEPEVSVNVGRITSLRRTDRLLDRIQIDARVNPGNSGGPLIDDGGRVVGIVNEGFLTGGTRVAEAGVNFAVPVSKLRALLETPELFPRFVPIDVRKLHDEAVLRVDAVSYFRPLERARLVLRLKSNGAEREFEAKSLGDGGFEFRFVPVPLPVDDPTGLLEATVRFPQGLVSGLVADRGIVVGERKLRLAEIRTLDRSATPFVETASQGRLEGFPKDLEALEARLGGVVLQVPLGQARRIEIRPMVASAPVVDFAMALTLDGSEVAKRGGRLPFIDLAAVAKRPDEERPTLPRTGTAPQLPLPPDLPSSPPEGSPATPPTREPHETLELPANVADVLLASGGRRLLLWLPKLEKLAVFDVESGKIERYVDLGGPELLLAAGRSRFVVVNRRDKTISRWSLETFERESVKTLPFTGDVVATAMGYDSDGPLLLNRIDASERNVAGIAKASFVLIDVGRLDVSTETLDGPPGLLAQSYLETLGTEVRMRAAGGGDAFGLWNARSNPSSTQSFVREGTRWRRFASNDHAHHVLPTRDGRHAVVALQGVLSAEIPAAATYRRSTFGGVPTTHSRFYLSLPTSAYLRSISVLDRKTPPGCSVVAIPGHRRMIDLPDLELGSPRSTSTSYRPEDPLGFDKRVLYSPELGRLVTVPFSDDRLHVWRFDLEERLKKLGVDYFFVKSEPPRRFRRGAEFAHAVVVASNRPGTTFALASGPPGMTVDAAGRMRWAVPADFPLSRVSVVVSVKDAEGAPHDEVYFLAAET